MSGSGVGYMTLNTTYIETGHDSPSYYTVPVVSEGSYKYVTHPYPLDNMSIKNLWNETVEEFLRAKEDSKTSYDLMLERKREMYKGPRDHIERQKA